MRCVYFCIAFEEKRGVVSLKRTGPLRFTPPPPPPLHPHLLFAFPSPPFFSPSLLSRPPLTIFPHARSRSRALIFDYSTLALGATQRRYVGPQRVCNRRATCLLQSGPSRGQAERCSDVLLGSQHMVIVREEVINPQSAAEDHF